MSNDQMRDALNRIETLGHKMWELDREIRRLTEKRNTIKTRWQAARDEFYTSIGKPNPYPQKEIL